MNNCEEILKLKIVIERYTGPGHTLEINLKEGSVFWTDDLLFYQKPKPIKVLNLQEREQLIKHLEQSNLLEWDTRYYDLSKMNGDLWSVEIIGEEEIRKIKGTGVVPKEWDRFTEGLSELIGKTIKLQD